MPRYIVLYKFTEQGRRNIKSTVQRAKGNQGESEKQGFAIRDIYWTQGQYDVVVIMDAPDEQTMMAGLLNIAEAGNVQSETMRAFTAEEMEQVLQKA